jgi:predicted nucleic acid-binding protein
VADVLVDTSAWILAVHRKDPRARQRLKEVVADTSATTCPMVLLEMLVGRQRGEDPSATRSRFSALNWLPCTDEVWDKAFALASEARSRGHTLPGADALVAAHAISAGAVLLHADSDFVGIAEWSGLEEESLLVV